MRRRRRVGVVRGEEAQALIASQKTAIGHVVIALLVGGEGGEVLGEVPREHLGTRHRVGRRRRAGGEHSELLDAAGALDECVAIDGALHAEVAEHR